MAQEGEPSLRGAVLPLRQAAPCKETPDKHKKEEEGARLRCAEPHPRVSTKLPVFGGGARSPFVLITHSNAPPPLFFIALDKIDYTA